MDHSFLGVNEKFPEAEKEPSKINTLGSRQQQEPAPQIHNSGAHPVNSEAGNNQQGTDNPHGHAPNIRPEAAVAQTALDSSGDTDLSTSFPSVSNYPPSICSRAPEKMTSKQILALQTREIRSPPVENGYPTPRSELGISSSAACQAYAVEDGALAPGSEAGSLSSVDLHSTVASPHSLLVGHMIARR